MLRARIPLFSLSLFVFLCVFVYSLQLDVFESRIRPILVTRCFGCHTDSQSGGLRLDSRENVMKGGKSGPAVIPGDPDGSLLIKAVRQTGDLKMPMGGRLRPDEVDALTEWVRGGAKWSEVNSAMPKAAAKADNISAERRAF